MEINDGQALTRKQKKRIYNDAQQTVSSLIRVLLRKDHLLNDKKETMAFFENIRKKQSKLFYRAMT